MLGRYKIIVTNKNIYKEIDLPPELEMLTLGTGSENDVRLRKAYFFENIQLILKKVNGVWQVICSDNIYLDVGDVRKVFTLQLKHGDEFCVRYHASDHEVLKIAFMIDFDYERKDYGLKIDVSTKNMIKIGSTPDADIQIRSGYLDNEWIILEKRDNNQIYIHDVKTKYGTYVNGIRIKEKQLIKECDFFSVAEFSFYYREQKLYTTDKKGIIVNGLQSALADTQSTVFEYPKFNRNTRIQYEIPKYEFVLQQPASKPRLKKRSLVLTLIPSLVMLAMTIVLRGIMGGGGTFVIYSVVSMGMGIIMSVITYIQERKDYKQEYEERIEKYTEYIEKKEKEIAESRIEELRIRRLIYESLENSIEEVKLFGKRLFEKEHENKDFLQVYLGKGTIESANQVDYSKQEFIDVEDPLATVAEEVSQKYRYIENAPIISDLHAAGGIGIIGRELDYLQILKNITLDIAIRHFYKDVKFVYILNGTEINRLEWVKWLHNVENKQIDARNIICDEESKIVVLENLYSVLSIRENMLEQTKNTVFDEHYIIFVTNAAAISSHPISKYIQDCTKYGFTFVFFEEHEEKLQQGCTEVIRLKENNSGQVIKAADGNQIEEFTYSVVSDQVAKEVAIKLGAIYVDEVSLESQLTKNISMYELLDILSIEDLNLEKRWNESQVFKTIAAPIGVKSSNEIVSLDISDKAGAHGPHGLVAGTTGSGKSEILQTYILSIATLFHPYDVGFVIIDFKGGGMANQFTNLPHLIGTITNIDGREINRSLLSIKSELVKRQEMFSEAGVNHINDYIKLFKAGKVTKPMPHLIMIVDEFAELKAEHPDFMKELISAARIGRTLGVHLILATQKPAGVVDAQIWSNSKFKLCLKVQTKEDSNEVLKTPLAAEIVEPGRAYFQVGNNEIFELIQSAYSGAKVPEGNDSNENIFAIYEKNVWGKKTLKYTNKKAKQSSQDMSQLDAIVKHVDDYCKASGIARLPGICLPSLETVINTKKLNYKISDAQVISVPIGMYDDPEQQRQEEVVLELSKDNVYVVGSAQVGKTVLLQTIAYGLIEKYTPAQVNLYMVDCGSMVLKMFEDSMHVGGVVLSNEEEKCKNLFKLLNTIIIERKKILSNKGIGNFASYLEAGYTDLPMVVVMIDNMAAFKEYFPNEADEINSISREAQGVGISFVITAATVNALNYRTQANFGKKFTLNCNDSGEYSAMFGHCKVSPRENPGRGLCVIDKRILEWQAAMFGESKKEAERSQELKEYIANRNKECPTMAVRIPMIPERLVLAEAMNVDKNEFRQMGILPIGMDFGTVAYSYVNMMTSGSLALLGDYDSQTMFMTNMLRMIAKTVVFHDVEAVVIDDKQRRLQEAETYGFVRNYITDVAEAVAYVSDFMEEVKKREDDTELSTLLLVLNNPEVFRQICADKTISKEFATALKQISDIRVFVVLGQIDNQAVGFSASDVLKGLKEERKGILFAPVAENKFYEASGRPKKETSFDKSMGYRFDNATCNKIKIFE